MFARYIGEEGSGLIPKEIYYINISEHLIQEKRILNIMVGDYWAGDYSSFGEAMTEWEFTQWNNMEELSLDQLLTALNKKLFSPNGKS